MRGRRHVDRRHVLGGRARRHRRRHRRAATGARRDRAVSTASCRSRCRPSSRTTPTARWRRRESLFARVDRPNVMIKIPGTLEGLRAIEDSIAAGINVNVTLIFSLDRHAKVIDAYLKGLERFAASGWRPVDGALGGVVLREPGRHRDRQAAPRGSRAAGQGRGRERQARVRAVPAALRRARAGTRSRRRARTCSARSGRRRPPRTRRTRPRSTSTS